ncbi:MAG: SDR family oxidoreductase [Bacteroidota bacterium]
METISLKKKVIWITGASKGIGAAIAHRLSDTGATLILSSSSENSFTKLKAEFASNNNIYFFPFNLGDENEAKLCFEKIQNQFGGVDILINNAGVVSFLSLLKTPLEVFNEIMNVNLRGAFLCIQSVLPDMLEKKSGIILNIVSVVAIKTFRNNSIYSASKAGLLAMSRSLREEVRGQGIKVVDILPGATETEAWSEEDREKFHELVMQPDDVAETVYNALLLSQNDRLHLEEIRVRPQKGDL